MQGFGHGPHVSADDVDTNRVVITEEFLGDQTLVYNPETDDEWILATYRASTLEGVR